MPKFFSNDHKKSDSITYSKFSFWLFVQKKENQSLSCIQQILLGVVYFSLDNVFFYYSIIPSFPAVKNNAQLINIHFSHYHRDLPPSIFLHCKILEKHLCKVFVFFLFTCLHYKIIRQLPCFHFSYCNGFCTSFPELINLFMPRFYSLK